MVFKFKLPFFPSGINSQSSFNFAHGKIQKLIELSSEDLKGNVVKVGAATGLTCGQLYTDGVYVKDFDGCHGDNKLELYNQFEVLSSSELKTNFMECGDSGSLVFLSQKGGDIVCIGVAAGCTSYGSCVATPIDAVFKAFKFPASFIDFTKSQTSF